MRSKLTKPSKSRSNGYFANSSKQSNNEIQAKLKANKPGDKYEVEADKMADQVVDQSIGNVLGGKSSTPGVDFGKPLPLTIRPAVSSSTQRKEEDITNENHSKIQGIQAIEDKNHIEIDKEKKTSKNKQENEKDIEPIKRDDTFSEKNITQKTSTKNIYNNSTNNTISQDFNHEDSNATNKEISIEEQEKLKDEFKIYCSFVLKNEDLANKDEFLNKRKIFLSKIDKKKLFGKDTYWGTNRYYRLRNKYFPDYKEIINLNIKQLKESINSKINKLNESLSKILDEVVLYMSKISNGYEITESFLDGKIEQLLIIANESYEKTKIVLKEYGKERLVEFQEKYEGVIDEYKQILSELTLNIVSLREDKQKLQLLTSTLKNQKIIIDDFREKVNKTSDIQKLLNLQKIQFEELNATSKVVLDSVKSQAKVNSNIVEKKFIEKKLNNNREKLDEYDSEINKVKNIEIDRRTTLEKRKEKTLLRKEQYEKQFNKYVKTLSFFMSKEKAEQYVRGFYPRPQTNVSLTISNDVGEGGENKAKDVKKIQDILIDLNYLSPTIQEVTNTTGIVSKDPNQTIDESKLHKTIDAIKKYQKYGATTDETILKQDGKVDKNGTTLISMRSMKKVQANYQFEKTNEEIPNVLNKNQFISQARFGPNYVSESSEKKYLNYITDKTDLNDPANLHTLKQKVIDEVKIKYSKDSWKDGEFIKKHGLKMKDKSRDTKPNWVCCFDAAKAMLEKTGANPNSKQSKIQTYVADIKEETVKLKDGKTEVEESLGKGSYTNQIELGIKYIDGQLKIGHAVFVGGEKGTLKSYNERVTDHFIVIIGKHKDSSGWYYSYFDPAKSDKSGYSDKNKIGRASCRER